MYPKLDYPWQQPVLDIFTTLRKDLLCKVNTAKRAIRERLRDPILKLHERIALHSALQELQELFPRRSNHQEFREVKSTSEPAKVLQIPSGAVRTRILKARSRIKTRGFKLPRESR